MMEERGSNSLGEWYCQLAATGLIRRVLELARDEDLGSGPQRGDITAMATIPAHQKMRGALVARDEGVVAGLAAMPELIEVFGGEVEFRHVCGDGQRVQRGNTLGVLEGDARQVLSIERTALNLVGRLSGIATMTARFVEALGSGTRAGIYDTRKTTPGLRVLEKYAVRCGGGCTHRLGLHDAVMIKDNHIAGIEPGRLGKRIESAATQARRMRPGLQFVEVEVDSLDQLREVLDLPPGVINIVLLDNMTLAQLTEAVQMRDSYGPRPLLEASGGVRLETVRAIGLTGVERISVGALTHSVSSLDVALDFVAGGA